MRKTRKKQPLKPLDLRLKKEKKSLHWAQKEAFERLNPEE